MSGGNDVTASVEKALLFLLAIYKSHRNDSRTI